ncbi:UDP-N-acetylglucosamine 2-epimerase [Tupanvirus deep ocean]|uniref:UDP-N-acetylglucosamine 2-epimerase n=2 Tax=Tupanvirus TaxID=2094720 RepID=A0AC62A9Q0_9VIRU|nr:UDP-N-acetylglucosamine 2-epimerase [Tupanvirus deep ocean]QKU34429.1 UDP-N-acetylglucosamine 2-epimerase [Tupanvirus deep ocean]
MKDHYGIEVTPINDLANMVKGNMHYIFEGAHYLYKNNGNKYLIVSFHGAVKNTIPMPVFRLYNRNYKNSDMLCISDGLLHKYKPKGLALAWFLSSEKYNMEEIYSKIIGHIIKNYTKILFIGTSGGGHAALYYACKFNGICLLGNSQIYLDKYKYYPTVVDTLEKNDDKLIIPNIEEMVKNHPPKRIIISTNTKDTHHYQEHSIPFVKYCTSIGYVNIKPLFFAGNTKATHAHYFKNKVGRLINNILK